MAGEREAKLLTDLLSEDGPWTRVSRRQLYRLMGGATLLEVRPGWVTRLRPDDRLCVLRATGGTGDLFRPNGEVVLGQDLMATYARANPNVPALSSAAVAPTELLCLRFAGPEAAQQWTSLLGVP